MMLISSIRHVHIFRSPLSFSHSITPIVVQLLSPPFFSTLFFFFPPVILPNGQREGKNRSSKGWILCGLTPTLDTFLLPCGSRHLFEFLKRSRLKLIHPEHKKRRNRAGSGQEVNGCHQSYA